METHSLRFHQPSLKATLAAGWPGHSRTVRRRLILAETVLGPGPTNRPRIADILVHFETASALVSPTPEAIASLNLDAPTSKTSSTTGEPIQRHGSFKAVR